MKHGKYWCSTIGIEKLCPAHCYVVLFGGTGIITRPLNIYIQVVDLNGWIAKKGDTIWGKYSKFHPALYILIELVGMFCVGESFLCEFHCVTMTSQNWQSTAYWSAVGYRFNYRSLRRAFMLNICSLYLLRDTSSNVPLQYCVLLVNAHWSCVSYTSIDGISPNCFMIVDSVVRQLCVVDWLTSAIIILLFIPHAAIAHTSAFSKFLYIYVLVGRSCNAVRGTSYNIYAVCNV